MTDQNLPEDRPFIIAKEKRDIIYIQMGGDINAETLPESRKLVDEIIEGHEIYKRRNLRILVDYGKVTSIDSASIANILERLKEHDKYQHKIAFVNMPQEFKDLIVLHKLEGVIPLFESEKDALRELRKTTQ